MLAGHSSSIDGVSIQVEPCGKKSAIGRWADDLGDEWKSTDIAFESTFTASFNEYLKMKLFVELNDVNYKGSTYDLTYDHQNDRLTGIYHQAASGQSFEVFFVRTK